MKISFVTPTYNRADLLVQTLNSIAAATGHLKDVSVEMVVVDDASTDGTEQVVTSKFSNLLNSGQLVYKKLQENVGVTGAKNRGAEMAAGDWVVFLDSDDLLVKKNYEKMVLELKERKDYDVLFFSCVDFAGNPIGSLPKSTELDLKKYLRSGTFGEKLPVIKKKAILSEPYEASLRGFEGLTYLRMLRKDKKIYISSLVCRKYRTDNEDRLSGRKSQLKRSENLAKGYMLKLREYKKAGVRIPLIDLIKLAIYSAVGLFTR